jgi:hypothetical protein
MNEGGPYACVRQAVLGNAPVGGEVGTHAGWVCGLGYEMPMPRGRCVVARKVPRIFNKS